MDVKKVVLGVSVMTAAAALVACSSGTATSSLGQFHPSASSVATSPTGTSTTSPKPTSSPPVTRSTTPSAPKANPTTLVARSANNPCAMANGACADLSTHQAWLIHNGQVSYGPVPIMPGKRGDTTPVGTFSVISKEKLHYSQEFNAPMPNSVFFYPGDAFHSGSLDAYSHGCIHLGRTASLKFFNTLQIGDEVRIIR